MNRPLSFFDYLTENFTLLLMSADDAPMRASKSPGSQTHSCLSASKKLRSYSFTEKVTVFVSPGASDTLEKPFNSFTGRSTDDLRSDMKSSTVSLPSLLPVFVTGTDTVKESPFTPSVLSTVAFPYLKVV